MRFGENKMGLNRHSFGPRSVALSLALIAVLVLSACSGIPRAGGVNQGSAVVPVENDDIEFLPSGPLPDSSAEQILRGFIEAASSPVSDYAIAREFLTPDFASQWDATTAVNVDAGIRTIALSSDAASPTGTLSFSLNAQVDAQGNYTEISTPLATTYDYTFEQVEGQWRISGAPNGVVIDRFTFDQVYQESPLYFFDSTNTVLVPDVRFFPAGASAGTRITKALLAGPSAWLASEGAVVTAFPAGTALVADTVPVTRGVATVDLNAAALSSDLTTVRRMKQQASASLQSVENISSVVLLVEGAVLNSSITDSVDSVMPRPVDSRPLVLTSSEVGLWSGSKIEQLAQLGIAIVSEQPTALTTALGNSIATSLSDAGVSLVRNGNIQLVDSRPGLSAPSLDNFGYVWSVPQASPSDVLVISTDGKQQEVTVPWRAADSILSLTLSHDGARVLALLETDGIYQLVVCAVVRGEKSVPLAVGTPVVLSLPPGEAIAAAWVDATTVVSIAKDGAGNYPVRLQIIGGQGKDLASITQGTPRTIAGANSVSGIRVLTAEGTLLTLRGGTQWQSVLSGVTALAIQQ
jgi:hypothetical protein